MKLFALLFLFVVAQCYTDIEEEKMVDKILDEFLGELHDETDKEIMTDFNSNKKRDDCSFANNGKFISTTFQFIYKVILKLYLFYRQTILTVKLYDIYRQITLTLPSNYTSNVLT